jgi:chemotaxis protein CheZ
MSHIGKRYRIEQSFASPDGGVLVSGSGDGRIGEILSTVQDLRRCFEPSQRRAGEVIEAYRREIAELYGLRAELDSMKGAIASTKREIATLRRSEDDGGGMRRAAGVATGNNDCVGAILDRTVALYEACNFQDLTGQRITKIVGVLKFVEERLDRMIGVWGGLDAFKELAGEQRHERAPGESALLNGPRLADDVGHVTQDDIDALFN